jgi:hypothetical protein
LEKTVAVGLNQRAQQRQKRVLESLENINKFLVKLKEDHLEELFRRDQVGVDTYAASGTGSSIVGFSRGSNSELTPTERAAENNGFKKKQSDPVRDETKKIERDIFKAEEYLRMAAESLTFLRSGVEKKRGRETTAPCEACGILPISKTGLCSECFLGWAENGYPDRQRYISYLNATRNSEGKILVTDLPTPRYISQTLDI